MSPRIADRKCAQPGCQRAPRWTPDGTRHWYCARHELEALSQALRGRAA